jgi:glycerol-3-phosphate dehydrogenase
MKRRSETLEHSKRTTFDVCVIGGGATGAGCALDAELRGLRTVLLDAADFVSATSSASTKLVHGGVRYLQQSVADCDLGQYRVVRRALRERKLMLNNAPFLACPLELLVPCFSRRDAYYFRIGLKFYDWISGRGMLSPSRFLSVQESTARLPMLNTSGLVGTVAYTDGQFDDARYGIALLKTFVENGGAALNYARVAGFAKTKDGKLAEAHVEDRLSQECFTVRAQVFVNATGPFSDGVRELANPGIHPRLRLSKGIHILLPLDAAFRRDAMLIPKTDDGRVIFAIPWLGRLLVGTTDDEATLDDELAVKQEEVEYLLRHLNRYLRRPFSIDQVVSAIAGLRPLVSPGDARNTKKLIRDHEVEVNQDSGLISVLGGKWTTYRAMAEDAVNAVQQSLKSAVSPCKTQHFPLAGAEGYEATFWHTLVPKFHISPDTAQHLSEKFGTHAVEVLELARTDSQLAAPIVAGASGIQAEIVYSIRHEMAASIEDVLARRIGLQWFSWNSAIAAAPLVGSYLAREHGWPAGQTQQAVREYTLKLTRTMRLAGLKPEQALAG